MYVDDMCAVVCTQINDVTIPGADLYFNKMSWVTNPLLEVWSEDTKKQCKLIVI